MPTNGIIDGNAPPFIVLVLILGALYATQGALREAEKLPRGMSFKTPARWLLYTNTVVFLILACLILIRIIKNGLARGTSFTELDLFILFGILLSYVAICVEGLLVSRLKRKYTEEVPVTLPESRNNK